MKTRAILLITALTLFISEVSAQLQQGQIIPLYDGVAPGSEVLQTTEKELSMAGIRIVTNVTQPTLEVFLPKEGKANGAAVLVCPGGGFAMLSYTTEGTLVAQQLAERGFTAFVLKYRLNPLQNADGSVIENQVQLARAMKEVTWRAMIRSGAFEQGRAPTTTESALSSDCTPLAFADGMQAMKLLRENANAWGFHPDRIGIMGFSAGSIIAMHVAQYASAESRPNFIAPIYGGWTKDVVVPDDAAPMFLCSPVNDAFTPDEQLNIYLAWRKAGKPVELHNYHASSHGFGAVPTTKAVGSWIDQMCRFMQDVGFVAK